jgi:hypothetical protein
MAKSLPVMVRLAGFGPAACGLEVRCSIQLSYRRSVFAGIVSRLRKPCMEAYIFYYKPFLKIFPDFFLSALSSELHPPKEEIRARPCSVYAALFSFLIWRIPHNNLEKYLLNLENFLT